jgi:hypothetical protein
MDLKLDHSPYGQNSDQEPGAEENIWIQER